MCRQPSCKCFFSQVILLCYCRLLCSALFVRPPRYVLSLSLLTSSLPGCLCFGLSPCGRCFLLFFVCRFLSSARLVPSPFLFFECLLPTFSLRISLSASTSSASAPLPVRASKQANSHAALLSQYNEIGSTQIERSHFLQLSTYYRGVQTYSSTSKGSGGERDGGDGGMEGSGFEVRGGC